MLPGSFPGHAMRTILAGIIIPAILVAASSPVAKLDWPKSWRNASSAPPELPVGLAPHPLN